MSGTKFLQNLKFDNLVLRQLPVDSSKIPGSRVVRSACFSLVDPTPVENPSLVCASAPALELLGVNAKLLEDKGLRNEIEKELSECFSGNTILNGSQTAAHCYCGHQFGYFSGQLGDGAAMYLGEVINDKSERWEIQLKGAGKTPFSRSADGRKVLRSSIREFLCSEAMHHLGIPTTRAGTVITSDSFVIRDMFYDGHAKREHCAVVLRIAPTFLRFGSFEIFKPMDPVSGRGGPSPNKTDILIQMLDYVLENFYSHIHLNEEWSSEEKYLKMYEEICHKTAHLVAKWQCVGFCHGVLNTDNMSILGLTIDYGPFGFLDRYNPDFICNSSDDNGRYSYKKQPDICHWNLKMLAHALKNALPLEKSLGALESIYYPAFNGAYVSQMRRKLGLFETDDKDVELIEGLLSMMKDANADYTNAFRALCEMSSPMSNNFDENKKNATESFLAACADFESTKSFVKPSLSDEQIEHLREARSSNPMYMLYAGQIRNLLDDETAKREKYRELCAMDEDGFKEYIREKWNTWLDRYVERLKLDSQNCDDHAMRDAQRTKMMKSNNPRYILRNYIAQQAIDEAEKGNFQEVQNVLKRLQHPYGDEEHDTCSVQASSIPSTFKNYAYCAPPPTEMLSLKVS